MRKLILAAMLLAANPALADMFPNAANADQPEALQNLTNQIISLSGGVLRTGAGTELNSGYGTSSPTVWGIYKGTEAAPITTAGQQIRIVYRQAVTKDKCYDNPADTGCNSPILVNAIGHAGTSMVTSGATFYARGSGTVAGTDVQAINAIGDVMDNGVGIGTGAYIQGRMRTTTGTGRALGAEISAQNYTGYNTCSVSSSALGICIGIWLAARSSSAATPLDSALQIGTGDNLGKWKQAITINSNAIFDTPNTGTRSFADYSTSEVSLYVRGTHSHALITDPASGNVGLGIFAPTAKLEMDGAYSAPYDGGGGTILRINSFTVTDTTSSGVVATRNASRIGPPTLAATNATTYTEAATFTIGGCPVAGTNVTITACMGLKVGGDLNVIGGVYRAGGTAGVSCTGAPTAGFRSVGGIVTVC